MPITAVASDYVIIAETPRPRDASCLLYRGWLKTQPVGGGYQTADGGAKLDQSCNAEDSIQWKFGVSNITKHLKYIMKLKECGVFDCYNKASTVSSPASSLASSPANAKDCSAVTAAPSCDIKWQSLLLSL